MAQPSKVPPRPHTWRNGSRELALRDVSGEAQLRWFRDGAATLVACCHGRPVARENGVDSFQRDHLRWHPVSFLIEAGCRGLHLVQHHPRLATVPVEAATPDALSASPLSSHTHALRILSVHIHAPLCMETTRHRSAIAQEV